MSFEHMAYLHFPFVALFAHRYYYPVAACCRSLLYTSEHGREIIVGEFRHYDANQLYWFAL